MTGIEATVIARVISQPILDIYNKGKDRFEVHLQKWKNAATRKSLAQKISVAQKVKPFWQRDKEILLSSFYYPNRVLFSPGVVKNITSLKDFPTIGNFVIQGTVGQGKSIFLRYLCVQELKETGSGRIPIFIELRTVTSAGLRVRIYDALDKLGFVVNDKLFDFYADSGNLVLMLDGFDELGESLVKDVICELEGLSEKYSTLQIIITSRLKSAIQESRLFRVIQLAGLEPQDHEPFIRKIGVKGDDIDHLMAAIRSSSVEISSLLTTPLMLTLFVIVYKSEHEIPKEIPDFFDSLFQTLFTRHDKSKPGFVREQKSGLGERALQQLFQAFCFCTIQLKQQTTLSNEIFHKVLEKAFKYTDISCTAEGFQYDITKVACLMQEEGFDFHFIHKSVLEFYAASFVRNANEDLSRKFYDQLVERPEMFYRWRQVMQFLSQIDKYRYTRYYAIPSITNGLKNFGLNEPFKISAIPDNIAEIIFNGVEVGFSTSEDHAWHFSFIGAFKQQSEFFNDLPDILSFHEVGLTESDTFDSEESLRTAYPSIHPCTSGHGLHKNDLSVAWDRCVKPKVRAEIDKNSKLAIREAIATLRAYEKYIEEESKKTQLLEL